MTAILQTTLSNAYFLNESCIFIQFSLKVVPRSPIDIKH